VGGVAAFHTALQRQAKAEQYPAEIETVGRGHRHRLPAGVDGQVEVAGVTRALEPGMLRTADVGKVVSSVSMIGGREPRSA